MIDALRVTGWAAALALVAALAMTPLSLLVSAAAHRSGAAARARRARRWLGITCALLALVHAALATSTYVGAARMWTALEGVAWLRSGALAAALLVPLLITSFPRASSALRVRAWKPLHRLAYPAAALVVHHVLFAPYAPRVWGVALAATLVALAIGRISPHRRSSRAARSERAEEPDLIEP